MDSTAAADQTPPQEAQRPRAAFYIDGFNVYHALDALKQPHLKWLDWHALGTLITGQRGEQFVRAVFCTAPPVFKPQDVQRRHQNYVRALETKGLIVKQGTFSKDRRDCVKCNHFWDHPQEKAGDTNLAVSLIGDAHADVFDTAYLVTADNDQIPTMDYIINIFGPTSAKPKKMVVVCMPGRPQSTALTGRAGKGNVVAVHQIHHLAASLLPKQIMSTDPNGNKRPISRPSQYDPPS